MYKQDKGGEQAAAEYFGDVLWVDKQAGGAPYHNLGCLTSTQARFCAPVAFAEVPVFFPFLCSLYPCVFFLLDEAHSNDAP